MDIGGTPRTSITRLKWSYSLSEGNNGYPVTNSTNMHPKLHKSIGVS
jgi:hypothetical protein